MFEPDNQYNMRRPRSLLSLSSVGQNADVRRRAEPIPSPDDDDSEQDSGIRQQRGSTPTAFHPERRDEEQERRVSEDETAPGLLARLRARFAGSRPTEAADEEGHLDAVHAAPPAVAVPVVPVALSSPHPDGDRYWRPLIDPLMVLGGVWNSKALIAATTIAGAAIGVAIALSTPKMYEATAELLVDPRELKIVERDLTATALPSDGTLAIVENQARVLVSGNVLTKVVDELDLAADPEFNGQASGFSIRGLVSDIRSILSGSDEGGGDVRRALAIGNLAESLDVSRSENTFVINVTASTRDAEKSAVIANKLTEVFLQTYGAIQANTAGRATDELSSRLAELQAGVEAAERAVEAFKAEHDIIDAQGRLITDDAIVKLNDQLSVARAHTIELNARAATARDVDIDAVLAGALPEQIASPVMTALRSQYSTLKQDVDRMSVRLGPRHPERLAAEAQLAGAREQIQIELRRINQAVQVDLQRAVQLEQDLAARLAQLKVGQADIAEEMVTLRELERAASSQRSVYEAYLLRARETGEQQTLNTANVSVISEAMPPLTSSGPSRAMTAILGTILGFLVGVGLGALRGGVASLSESGRMARTEKSRRQAQPISLPFEPTAWTGGQTYPPYRQPQMQTSLYPRAHGVELGQRSHPQQPLGASPAFDPVEWPADDDNDDDDDDDASPAARRDADPIEDIRESLRELREAVYELAASRSLRRHY